MKDEQLNNITIITDDDYRDDTDEYVKVEVK